MAAGERKRGRVRILKRWSETLLELAFPGSCAACHASFAEATPPDGVLLCEECREKLQPHAGGLCRKCGAPLPSSLPAGGDCPHCRRERFAFSGAVCLGAYDRELRTACLRGKDEGGIPLLAALAKRLVAAHGETLRRFAPDRIVPVPQHWRTRWRRAHNPTEILARVLSRELGCPLARRLLFKTRWTAIQASLGPSERRTNVVGAFSASRWRAVRGARILLVDDVLTTGSTAHACAKTLRNAGAEEIFVAVLARGLG